MNFTGLCCIKKDQEQPEFEWSCYTGVSGKKGRTHTNKTKDHSSIHGKCTTHHHRRKDLPSPPMEQVQAKIAVVPLTVSMGRMGEVSRFGELNLNFTKGG